MEDWLNTKVFGVKWSRLLTNIQQTLYMVGWALLIGTVVGLLLALLLVLTRKGGILKGKTAAAVHTVLNLYVNIVRSVPFVILLVTIMPFTRLGANVFQVIRYFIVPETLGSVVLALTTGTIGLLGASAMAGYVGGGGVGDLALTYGYEKMNTPLMIVTVIILVVFVQLIQLLGSAISRKLRAHQG